MRLSYVLALGALALSACSDTGNDSKDKDPDETGFGPNAGDEDGDNYKPDDGDCDDSDPNINPGALEICDGVDNDCDGLTDEDLIGTWYEDADGDGYGDDDTKYDGCAPDPSWVQQGGDCDDTQFAINPGAAEICDGIDNDCDGQTDEDLTGTYYRDSDGDGFGDTSTKFEGCNPGGGWVTQDGDCDDGEPAAHPGATEICDEIDNDCDGKTDENVTDTYYMDADGDGFGDPESPVDACEMTGDLVDNNDDCDDTEAAVNPAADEVCNYIDDDCDGDIDEGVSTTYYEDGDADGFGDDATAVVACEAPGDDWIEYGGDCDDEEVTVHPSAPELCDALDNDCDGTVDEGAKNTYYRDADGDGYGDPSATTTACEPPSDAWVTNDDDCNDSEPLAWTGATEVCDYVDNDCDGKTDEGVNHTYYEDSDGDAYGDPATATIACEAPGADWTTVDGDCNDDEPLAWTGHPEVCDYVDNDCDGSVDEGVSSTYYHDGDGDTYGDPSTGKASCSDPGDDWVTNSNDCNDAEDQAWTGHAEVCDTIDNDCDGAVDEGVSTTYYNDADGDSYGNPKISQDACSDPGAAWVSNDDDCNDLEDQAWTGHAEYCDSIDNDCNGKVDDSPVDGASYPQDSDGDGFGDPVKTTIACEPTTDNTLDCDDTDPDEPQVVDASATLPPDGTLTRPWWTVGDGILAASQCVAVDEGLYEENVDFSGKDILVFAMGDQQDTILFGSGSGSVVTFNSGETAAAELRGFTVTSGAGTKLTTTGTSTCGSSSTCTTTWNRYYGGGIYVDGAAPTLTDLMVSGNVLPGFNVVVSVPNATFTYSYGGGIFVNDAVGMSMSNVEVTRNNADVGAGVYFGDSVTATVDRLASTFNIATSDGGGIASAGGNVTITNALVVDNTAANEGGGVHVEDGRLSLVNASVVGNNAETGGNVAAMGSVTFTLMNSIIASAGAGEGVYVDSSATCTPTYNDVYGNAGGEWVGISDPTGINGNLSVDPQFVSFTADNTENDDYGLRATSPCVDAGNPAALYFDTDGTRNDMGAYGGKNGGLW